MKQTIKRMVLTGAAVAVMMSFAAPAMADEAEEPTNDPGLVEKAEEPYKDPGIRLCDITPTECEDTDDSSDDHGHDSGAHPDANDPNPVEEEESKEEAASTPGGMMVGEVAGGTTKSAPENDATSAPKIISAPDEAGQTANSPTVRGCAYDDQEVLEELDTCVTTPESLEFWNVLIGEKPLPDSVGGYVGLAGGFVEDWLTIAGTDTGVGGKLTEAALNWFGEDTGPIGWAIQGVGYTAGFAGEVGGVLLEGLSEVAGSVHDGLGEAVDAVVGAAEDAWDAISGWW